MNAILPSPQVKSELAAHMHKQEMLFLPNRMLFSSCSVILLASIILLSFPFLGGITLSLVVVLLSSWMITIFLLSFKFQNKIKPWMIWLPHIPVIIFLLSYAALWIQELYYIVRDPYAIYLLLFPLTVVFALPMWSAFSYGMLVIVIFFFTMNVDHLQSLFLVKESIFSVLVYVYVLVAITMSRLWFSRELKKSARKNIVFEQKNKILQYQCDKFYHQAYYDFLTGLYNRAMAESKIYKSIALAQDEASSLAVLFIDVDNFKVVNDKFGHRIGDEALLAVADRLRHNFFDKWLSQHVHKNENKGFIARLSGDEFIAIAVGVDADKIKQICRKLVSSCAKPYKFTDVSAQDTPKISVSIGAVRMSFSGDQVYNQRLDKSYIRKLVLKKSDATVYLAKRKKNTFVFREI